jgi:hypothetical protein
MYEDKYAQNYNTFALSFGCETWYLALVYEQKLKLCENKIHS